MYATVVIQASSFSVRSKDPTKPLPSTDLLVPEILASVTISGCSLMSRLLANDEHAAAVRDFRIVGYPAHLERAFFLNFVKHIWSTAKALTKVNHEYFPAEPVPFPGPCWSNTLYHLTTRHICWWTLRALEASSTRRLTLQSCTKTTDKLYGNKAKNLAHITHFEYLWHNWKGDKVEEFNFDWIPEVFPNLSKLRIAVCPCWVNQGIPEKVMLNDESPRTSHLTPGQIYQGALCNLVCNLPFLDTFTIGEVGENTPLAEEEFTLALWRSQPSLREVKFEWRGGNGVSWQRHDRSDTTCVSDAKDSQTLWTPDPTYPDRHLWWFRRFGLPEASRPEMMVRWHHKGYHVPSERDLYTKVFSIVMAELLEKTPCEWKSKGQCDCRMCVF
jgi:hypothetical protein